MLIDRQTLLFFIILFIMYSLPNGNDEPHSTKDAETLLKFQEVFVTSRSQTLHQEYYAGYGNVTGFLLSYEDNMKGKNVLDWPFHEFSKEDPWKEDERYLILPNSVSSRVHEFWGKDPIDDLGSNAYLLNITGGVHGKFEVVQLHGKLRAYEMPLPHYLQLFYADYTQSEYEKEKERYEQDPETNPPPTALQQSPSRAGNVTYSHGVADIEISSFGYNFMNQKLSRYIKDPEKDAIDDAVVVKVNFRLSNEKEVDVSELETFGIYFQKTGALITVSSSAKFRGGNALPHLLGSEDNYDKARLLVSQLLGSSEPEKDISMSDLTLSVLHSQNRCEVISYIQLARTDFLYQQLREMDEELKAPKGIPLPGNIPKIEVKDLLLYSPDCGIVVGSKLNNPFFGQKEEATTAQFKQVYSVFLLLVLAQFYLLIQQMKEARTPGQLSNISSVTIAMLSFQEAVVGVIFLFRATVSQELYLLLASIAAITMIMSGIFGMRLLMNILITQGNERGTTWWEVLRGSSVQGVNTQSPSPAPGNAVTQGGGSEIVAPPTPQATAPAVTNATAPQDEASYANGMFAPGFLLSVVTTFLILNSFLWRASYRRIFEFVLYLGSNSYWIPQFLRYTLKNRSHALLWQFVLGSTVIRVIPIAYVCLVRSNPWRHHYDPALISTLVCWEVFQLGLLFLQKVMGPRFWVKEKWLPKAYNYHPLLSINDLESGFSSDILASLRSPGAQAEGKDGIVICKVDCAICMGDIDLPVSTKEVTKKGNLNRAGARDSMVTPCFHVFHKECLEDWMVYKLQCPVCRNALPPV